MRMPSIPPHIQTRHGERQKPVANVLRWWPCGGNLKKKGGEKMGFAENMFVVGLLVAVICGGVLIVHGIGLVVMWVDKRFR
jgi:hypothetical protein